MNSLRWLPDISSSFDYVLQLIFLSVNLFESVFIKYNLLSFEINGWFECYSEPERNLLLSHLLDLIHASTSSSSYFIQDRLHSRTYFLIFGSPGSSSFGGAR